MMTRYRDVSLSELVHAARSRVHPEHEDAFGEIVRRFRANAQASAYRLVQDTHLAEDVAQEAFLDAYLGLEALRDPAAFPGWFRRILFKHADRIRRRPRGVVAELGAAEGVPYRKAGPEAAVAAREDAVRVRRALEALPEHERAVVVLFYFAQQSHAEIAQRLTVPVSTVKKRLHDARRRLRRPLEAPESPLSSGHEPPGDAFDSTARPARSDSERELAMPPLVTHAPGAPGGSAPADACRSESSAFCHTLAPPIHGSEAMRLAEVGTPEARGELLRYEPEQLANALQELGVDDRVAFLEMADRLPEIVPCLPEVVLTQTMRGVGLADAGWLIEFASPEQKVAAFDLDCWRDGRLSPGRLFEWIDALIEAGTETLLAAFDDIDAELWIVALKRMATFSIPGHSGAGLAIDPWDAADAGCMDGLTEDGVVFYEPTAGDHEERIHTILSTARVYVPSLYWDFVYGAITESSRSCEESAARWQRGRLNDLGFPDVADAMGIYRRLPIDEVPRVESMAAPPASETAVPDVLIGTALGRAVAALPAQRASEIMGQLFSLANAIAVADRLSLSVAAALEHSLGKALEGVDRGLAALAAARHRSLSEIADTTSPRDLFRVGMTLSPELHPQPSLGELEAHEADAEGLDWGVSYEWLAEEDETLDPSGRPR